MAVLLKVFPEKRLVCSEFYGEVTDDEILHHALTIKSHPQFDPAFSEIVDFTGVTQLRASEKALQQLAKTKSVFRPDSKHAAIASTPAVYELARLYQAQADSRILAVVQTRQQACLFLGIEGDLE